MRVIIAGSRTITDYKYVVECIEHAKNCGIDIDVVVQGEAEGVDLLGKRWAIENGVPHDDYPAQWGKFGTQVAGHVRNMEMADNADALIAIWDGKSTGTLDMIEIANRRGLPCRVYTKLKLAKEQPSTLFDFMA